jgi:hypothetical protein
MLKPRKVIPLLAAIGVLALLAVLAVTWRGPSFIRKHAEDLNAFDVAEPPPPPSEMPLASAMMPSALTPPPPEERLPGGGDTGDTEAIRPIAVGVPKLAYAYKLGFRLANTLLAEAQEAHVRLCEDMGPARCHVLAMARGAVEDSQTPASLKLRVAASEARNFSAQAVKLVSQAGGRAIATSLSAEDVSKAIVDAEARIKQRELLVSRLTEILRTRSGKVAELVEAERSVAQAQEELDQTRGWLTELRARVAMSDFEIAYEAVAPAASPVTPGNRMLDALQGSFAGVVATLQALIVLAIYLLPWVVILVPLGLFVRRRLRRAEAMPVEPEVGA